MTHQLRHGARNHPRSFLGRRTKVMWIRLDVNLLRNHKVLALLDQPAGHRTALVYVGGLCYAGEQETAGFIPREALGLIHGRRVDALRLVEARLWHAEDGGWVINGWAEYQPSTEEMRRRSDKARAAAAARWRPKLVNGVATDAPSIAPGNAPSNART